LYNSEHIEKPSCYLLKWKNLWDKWFSRCEEGKSRRDLNWMWCCTPVITTLGRLRQEDFEFEASLGCKQDATPKEREKELIFGLVYLSTK
jgi:hypothetical protein